MMILVTGASGQLGRLVIDALLASVPAEQIVAAVRSPQKVQDLAEKGVIVRQADYSAPATLASAFVGVTKALLISSSEIGQRTAQHQAVIDAAKAANVQLLAYTSLLKAEHSPLKLSAEHKATEAYLAQSAVPYVLLRNGWYLENHTAGIVPALSMGAMISCAGDGQFASASRADYAAAAAKVLTTEGHVGKVYELAGDEAFTVAEFAAQLGEISGQTVAYQNLPEDAYIKALEQAGMPTPFAEILADADTGAANGYLYDGSQQLSQLIGRPTTTLSDAIKAAL